MCSAIYPLPHGQWYPLQYTYPTCARLSSLPVPPLCLQPVKPKAYCPRSHLSTHWLHSPRSHLSTHWLHSPRSHLSTHWLHSPRSHLSTHWLHSPRSHLSTHWLHSSILDHLPIHIWSMYTVSHIREYLAGNKRILLWIFDWKLPFLLGYAIPLQMILK